MKLKDYLKQLEKKKDEVNIVKFEHTENNSNKPELNQEFFVEERKDISAIYSKKKTESSKNKASKGKSSKKKKSKHEEGKKKVKVIRPKMNE